MRKCLFWKSLFTSKSQKIFDFLRNTSSQAFFDYHFSKTLGFKQVPKNFDFLQITSQQAFFDSHFSKTLVYKQNSLFSSQIHWVNANFSNLKSTKFTIFSQILCLNANFLNLKSPNLPFFLNFFDWMPTF